MQIATPDSRYDIVFLGGGAATLSLLMRLVQSGVCGNKRFLVIDSSDKKSNDRTWCYWEKESGYFEEVVHHRWSSLEVNNFNTGKGPDADLKINLDLGGYQYKMIRGADFYRHCLNILSDSGLVHFLQTTIKSSSYAEGSLRLEIEGYTEPLNIATDLVFNSIPSLPEPNSNYKGLVNLLQHFKGITIESSELLLDTSRANLMDFRTDQQHGTSFFYVLPLSKNKALVEYTLFTPSLLTPGEYDAGLKKYITERLGLSLYQVVEEEFGIIPMTNYRFSFYERGIFNIGTAGGQTKGSSGYTFHFIQKRADQLAAILTSDVNWVGVEKKLRTLSSTPARFHFYDNVLLNVLWNKYLPGDKVFTRLFQRNPAHKVFSFLDNETTLPEEIRIISSLPTWPFFKAAVKSL